MPDIKTGSVTVTGLSELERQLEQFTDRVAKNIMTGALRAGAVVIQREARQRCPVGREEHWLGKKGGKGRVLINPGELKRKGIKVRVAPRKSRSVPVEYWVYVSKRYWYWRFLEFGTAKMSSRPFLRPAFEAMKERAAVAIRDYLGARIEKEAAKK